MSPSSLMGSISIIASFLAGLLVAGLAAALGFRRFRRESGDRFKEQCRLQERENELRMQEWTQTRELELERRKAELEARHQSRQIELHAREEEAVASLQTFEKERELLEKRRAELTERYNAVEQAEDRLQGLVADYRSRLQKAAQLSQEEARERLFALVRSECDEEVRRMKEEILNRSEKDLEGEARRTLLACMQRLSTAPQQDATATLVAIPSDDMKGRIIGREGRNIKSFESVTGTTLLIDETPDSVLISSFDPVRREIARVALESLIKDGRIHPGSIEEAVQRAEEEIKQSVVESGEDTLRRLRLGRMHPEVVAALGKLRFRLSNNQNSLEHSIEVSNLCALIASELGLDTQIAKRSGLLHDIGKVLDHEHEGSHAMAGAYFIKRLGEEPPEVINAIAAHHSEVPAESPYVALVMIADSISAMRPGARADSLEGYLHRVRSLEEIARSLDGVADAYAIQAGREIRVIASPEALSEDDAAFMARRIRRRIEDELQYPGTIKVTVIREQRFTETAR